MADQTEFTLKMADGESIKTIEGLRECENMEQHIRSQLKDSRIRIYYVNSVATRTRFGQVYPSFGRDAVLEQIFELLWSDIARKVAGKDVINDSEVYMNSLLDQQLSIAEHDIERIKLQIKTKCQARLKPLIEFCNEYGAHMGYEIEIDDPFDFIGDDFDIDYEEVLQQTKVGRFIDEMENMDEDNAWEMLKVIGKGLGILISWKKYLRDAVQIFLKAYRHSIPSEQIIENVVYSSLMEGYTVTSVSF